MRTPVFLPGRLSAAPVPLLRKEYSALVWEAFHDHEETILYFSLTGCQVRYSNARFGTFILAAAHAGPAFAGDHRRVLRNAFSSGLPE